LYNELYKAWKSERTAPSLEPLPIDFYQRIESYLSILHSDSTSSDAHTIQGRLIIREEEVASRLITELRETRIRKIFDNAKNGIPTDENSLTEEEQELAKTLKGSRIAIRDTRPRRSDTSPVNTQIELTIVRFLQDIPEIVGTDLKIYGPYKKEDVGSLPMQNAQALIKQAAAKFVEVRGLSQNSKTESMPINNK
jgi:DNA replication initiation complex subunit (GINS family)